ncbi:MAG TPA: saccharopine dehydrogenase C-terminal domain-containing protein [Steroidobacteraceae bacterium]|nr:saccharopine dehydrogenase C-terminal domain-containing protein [Steroidobacteraceae bacterium]
MTQHPIHVDFPGRILMVGFGSIGQGVLPLILRHIGQVKPERITIIAADDNGQQIAQKHGVKFINNALTRDNYKRVLEPLVGRGDFLLNVSVDVSSIALIKLCWEKGALYLDTCIEPWPGGYTDPTIPPSRRTNYALREDALQLRTGNPRAPTAVLTHGANPGLVSHFVKQALVNVAKDTGVDPGKPATREEWGKLAQKLNVSVVHIAERDTQLSNRPKQMNEFVNTWSVDGFVSEGQQPAELGWGSHERNFPRDGARHDFGCQSAIYLNQPGAATRVRTWTPKAGHFHGFLITHGESISISDYFTVRDGMNVAYRPTVHYAYHPCDNAVLSVHEFAGRNWRLQDHKRIMMEDILSKGIDELGVLLAGHKRNAYWYGSQLSIDEARKLAPYNNATSLQVTVACLSGMIWAIENPSRGLIEPDEMDYERNLEICMPYLGPVVGEYTDWNPLFDRGRLFPEDIDKTDPWQFKNVRV